MSAPEDNDSFDLTSAFHALDVCATASTPEALLAVQFSVQSLASETALAGLKPEDQKSASRLLVLLLTLSEGEPGRLKQHMNLLPLASDTNEKSAADEDATMEDAEDGPNQGGTKASLGGMTSPERPAGNPQDEAGNEESDADQEMQADTGKTPEKQRDTPRKRPRKSGSRDATYQPSQKLRKKSKRDCVTKSKPENDPSEDPDQDSDSSASTELQRQGNSAQNAAKPLSRSLSAQTKANRSSVTALGRDWSEGHYSAMCQAVLNRAKELKWDQKKQDVAHHLVCELVLSSAAENIATNVVRFAISRVNPQHNAENPATSQDMTEHVEQPRLIYDFNSWSNFWSRIDGLSEWGKIPQTAAMHAAFGTATLLEEQVKARDPELLAFLRQAVPDVPKPRDALKEYLAPRSPWAKAVTAGAGYLQKHRANMEYVFLSALGGSAALLLCSKDSSLRSVLGNHLTLSELRDMLPNIRDNLSLLPGLVHTLDHYVWQPLINSEFAMPENDWDLEPLFTDLRRDGWHGVVEAIEKAMTKVIEERSNVVQDAAMEGIEFGDDVGGTNGLLSGLSALGVYSGALEEEETGGGQSYFDEAMASGGKEADIPVVDGMAINDSL